MQRANRMSRGWINGVMRSGFLPNHGVVLGGQHFRTPTAIRIQMGNASGSIDLSHALTGPEENGMLHERTGSDVTLSPHYRVNSDRFER